MASAYKQRFPHGANKMHTLSGVQQFFVVVRLFHGREIQHEIVACILM